jgi:CheY-like chemotaxis protein
MGTTILVVEDEVKIRELLRSYLEREGFDVVSTGSGADAIVLAQTAAPDLVILDLRLPDVRGESVASEIRRFSGVPVLMLTAKSADQDRIHGLELGADDYVTKPFSPASWSSGRRPSSAGDSRLALGAGRHSSEAASWSSTRSGASCRCGVSLSS